MFYWRYVVTSKIIESLRGDLAALQDAGAISKVTMREFDAICPPPVGCEGKGALLLLARYIGVRWRTPS